MRDECARPRRVLVVGGSGFIGSHVVDRLLQESIEVFSIDLNAPHHLGAGIEWLRGSAHDESLLAPAAARCDAVIFLAAYSLPSSSDGISVEAREHVGMVVRAAEICEAQGVRRIIFGSSGGTVYDPMEAPPYRETSPVRPLSAHGASKLSIEMYLSVLARSRDVSCVSLRVANPYGPRQTAFRRQGFIAAAMASAFKREPLVCYGDGSVVRDFVYVEDVADAFARSCRYDGPSCAMNVGSGVGRSLRYIIERCQELSGRMIEVDYKSARPFDAPINVLDIGLAHENLGWRPVCSFENGLRRTIEWWQATTEMGQPPVDLTRQGRAQTALEGLRARRTT